MQFSYKGRICFIIVLINLERNIKRHNNNITGLTASTAANANCCCPLTRTTSSLPKTRTEDAARTLKRTCFFYTISSVAVRGSTIRKRLRTAGLHSASKNENPAEISRKKVLSKLCLRSQPSGTRLKNQRRRGSITASCNFSAKYKVTALYPT